MMFSLLSQGYGTYDGTAKKDVQEIPSEQKVNTVTYRVDECCRKLRMQFTRLCFNIIC